MTFWNDVPFSERVNLFDFSHFMFMITVLFIVGVYVWKLNYVKEHWKMIKKVLIGFSILQIIALYSWSIFELGFSLEAGLPIHMCRMSTFLGLYFLITEDKRVFNALYYMSVFAIIAIVYPVNVHPIYTHIIGWSYQISHILIVLVWITGVFIFGYRPTYKVLHQGIVIFVIAYLLVWQFNYLVGEGEYLYIRGDVNRPFLKEMNDIIWIGITSVISYIVMFLMTWGAQPKK